MRGRDELSTLYQGPMLLAADSSMYVVKRNIRTHMHAVNDTSRDAM